jgi:hypothetical protein
MVRKDTNQVDRIRVTKGWEIVIATSKWRVVVQGDRKNAELMHK